MRRRSRVCLEPTWCCTCRIRSRTLSASDASDPTISTCRLHRYGKNLVRAGLLVREVRLRASASELRRVRPATSASALGHAAAAAQPTGEYTARQARAEAPVVW